MKKKLRSLAMATTVAIISFDSPSQAWKYIIKWVKKCWSNGREKLNSVT